MTEREIIGVLLWIFFTQMLPIFRIPYEFRLAETLSYPNTRPIIFGHVQSVLTSYFTPHRQVCHLACNSVRILTCKLFFPSFFHFNTLAYYIAREIKLESQETRERHGGAKSFIISWILVCMGILSPRLDWAYFLA
jgi:hypothetical protein